MSVLYYYSKCYVSDPDFFFAPTFFYTYETIELISISWT